MTHGASVRVVVGVGIQYDVHMTQCEVTLVALGARRTPPAGCVTLLGRQIETPSTVECVPMTIESGTIVQRAVDADHMRLTFDGRVRLASLLHGQVLLPVSQLAAR